MKKTIITLFFVIAAAPVPAQDAVETTAVPAADFLSIIPDSRSLGMGATGVAATGGGAYSYFHNPSAALLSGNEGAISYTFTPWMREISSGYSLNSLGGFYNVNGLHSIMAGFRLFNHPSIQLSSEEAVPEGRFRPKELAFDLGYAYLITDNLSAGMSLRYINSKSIPDNTANSVAFSIGAMYKQEIGSMDGANWALGLNVANIGPKIKLEGNKYDLPAIAKLGGSVYFPFSYSHRLMLALDLGYRIPSDVSGINGGVGVEYAIVNHVFVRGGYHFGDEDKGDNSYGTTGIGLNFRGIFADFAYLIAKSDSPMKNTFNFSFGFQF